MKFSHWFKHFLGVSCLLISTAGHTISASNQARQLPEVACRYEMKIFPNGKSEASTSKSWYFWRKSSMIQTRDADGDYGEIWEQSTNGSIQYRKLYHADKTAVEYMPADRTTHNINFDWIKLSSMLSPQDLDSLKSVKKTNFLGFIAELHKGQIDGLALEVVWLPNESLPASIIRESKAGRVELQLVELEPLSASHRKPVSIEAIANYRHIDSADFGDMENDPFVKKVLASSGHHH
jgi:hypothetical protein